MRGLPAIHQALPEGGARAAPAWLGARFVDILASEQDRWILWLPVLIAFGIATYFALPQEPSLAVLAASLLLLAGLCWSQRNHLIPFLILGACAAFTAGATLAKARTDWVDSTRLTVALNAVMVKGWVERVDRNADQRVRLQLQIHSIARLKEADTPVRALISLRKGCEATVCSPGQAISLLAFLSPLPDPVMPGGYDYALDSYLRQVGATGFAPGVPEIWTDAPPAGWMLDLAATVQRVRLATTERILQALPGEAGAIAAALLTGMRGGIGEEPLNALRIAGLAHVLAISGLHMSLMAGSLFWLVRALLALHQTATLRLPVKKIAAATALAGAALYLVLSGASISTQRAFIMIAIMFIAILLGRPALSMRNVATAAVLVMLWRPESILTASFQMSFAATLGLIAAYERRPQPDRDKAKTVQGWARPLRISAYYMIGLAVTTIVASAATAPFAAYHFSRLAPFSVLGNMLAMPIVGFLIMPAGLAALLAMPFGLEQLPLSAMGWGIERLVEVASFVATLPGADSHVARMPVASLVLIVVGCLWLALWRTKWRWLSVMPVLAAIPIAHAAKGPDILIDAKGRAVAVRHADSGRLDVFDPSRNQFSAGRWLAADGDERTGDKIEAEGFACDASACISPLPDGGTLAIVKHREALAEECASARIVIITFRLAGRCEGPGLVLDAARLARYGAHAIWFDGDSLRVESARSPQGHRPWWPKAPARSGAPQDENT